MVAVAASVAVIDVVVVATVAIDGSAVVVSICIVVSGTRVVPAVVVDVTVLVCTYEDVVGANIVDVVGIVVVRSSVTVNWSSAVVSTCEVLVGAAIAVYISYF